MYTNNDLEVFTRARDKIAAGWIRGKRHARSDGYDATFRTSTHVCAIGAFEFALDGILNTQTPILKYMELMDFKNWVELADYSNFHGQGAIVAKFDAGIKRMKELMKENKSLTSE